MEKDILFGHLLKEKAEVLKDQKFLLYNEGFITYVDLYKRVRKVARGLEQLEVRKGDKVALIIENRLEFLEVWFATAMLGAVLVPINSHLIGKGLIYILNHSDSVTLILSEGHYSKVSAISESLPKLKTVIWLGNEPKLPSHLDAFSYEELTNNDALIEQRAVSLDDVGEIIYTSGTTGPPKGVLRSQRRYLRKYESWLGFTKDDIFYSCFPLFHGLAQGMILMAFHTGGQVALGREFSATRFWDEIRIYGATWFNHVGGTIPMLLNQPPKPNDREHSAKYCYGLGAPPNRWVEFEKRFGVQIIEYYGTTEAAYIVNWPNPRIGSIGRPSPRHGHVKLVDDHDVEVPAGVPGEIITQITEPEAVFDGYYKMPDETREKIRGGWFRTGDLAQEDTDGYLYYVSRKVDFIRRRGENISPWEIETIINDHPLVQESAAVAVPSEVGEDEIKLCVVPKEGASLDALDVFKFCQSRLAYYLIPRYIDIRQFLPKNALARVERWKLKEEGIPSHIFDGKKAGVIIPKT